MVSRYHSSKNDFWKLSERNSFLSPSSSLLREPKASERFSHHITIHPIPGISINRRNFLPGRSLLAKALEELRLLNWRAWKSNSEVSAVNSLCLQSSGVEHTRPSSLLAPGLGLGSSSCSFATSQASAPEPQLCPVHSTCNTLCLRSSWVELRTQVVALKKKHLEINIESNPTRKLAHPRMLLGCTHTPIKVTNRDKSL